MQADRDPWSISVLDLVPTQGTAGLREIDIKRRRWREKGADERATWLARHRVPVVLGPGVRRYLIDGHHVMRALHEEGSREVPYFVHANMAALAPAEFWPALERRNWAHPFDEAGKRCRCEDMPETVVAMTDDVFRSLASALKRAGGYWKNQVPFSELRWADFLRSRVPRALVESEFDQALSRALELSGSRAAAALPGWRGRADPTAAPSPNAAVRSGQRSSGSGGGRQRGAMRPPRG